MRVARGGLALGLVALSWGLAGAAAPPWERVLRGDDARRAARVKKEFDALQEAGRFEEALKLAVELEQLRQRVQGADHWEAVNAHWRAEAVRRVLAAGEAVRRDYTASGPLERQALGLLEKARYRQAQPLLEQVVQTRRKALGEDHPDTAAGYSNLASALQHLGRFKEADELYHRALGILRRAMGEEHPAVASCCNGLAGSLDGQGRYPEAESLYRQVLAIRRKAMGEREPDTADAYSSLAFNLYAQGRYHEAEDGFRRALDIHRKVHGEEHPDTALGYNNLAFDLQAQGRYREAGEGLRRALDIFRHRLGEEHSNVAACCNNLAYNLQQQGRYRESEELYRHALDIWRHTLGEENSHTAIGHDNLAHNLDAQGRYQPAEQGHRRAVEILRKTLGETHPETAQALDNLALNLGYQRRYKEAEEIHRSVLAVRRKVLGEGHPNTAQSYSGLASALVAQGRIPEGQESYRRALNIYRQALGEDHVLTARTGRRLADALCLQGRFGEAEEFYTRAADAFLANRLRVAASGLERAARIAKDSPLAVLAAVLAHNGKPVEAWRRYEESLGRGTWDDLSARLRRPPAEQARQADLAARLDRLDRLLQKTPAGAAFTPQQRARRDDLLAQRLQAQKDLADFAHSLEQKYGPAAGQVFDRATIQAALADDTALLGWVDLVPHATSPAEPGGDHWAVLLRHRGEPVWVHLGGSGDGGAWTRDDNQLAGRLRAALQSPREAWRPLAERVRQQRLGGLARHLDGVRHLVVLPSSALAGVPVEAFADGYTVSYTLSGTLYAHLRRQPQPTTRGLLALGDPVFTADAGLASSQPLPPGGVLLTQVAPGGNAAQAGLRPNDVLLRYGTTELAGPAELKALLAKPAGRDSVAVTVWRGGRTSQLQVQPGKLGATLADDPAPRALAQLRRLDRLLATRGDESWEPLPGTRAEVEALGRLFGDSPPRLLLGSQASEQELAALARHGELGKYRYLHLATHGEIDDTFPLRSAVILSRDSLPDPAKQLEAGLPVYDGRLEAQEVLQQWHLNAELVTLSACQTALGKYERGEGFVGFAQALILAGSRSVCLSLWKVDDTATALLMHRFYANLLGQRQGLQGPMGKAAALREAKEWLRGLSRDEALRVAAAVSRGVERGKGQKRLLPLPEVRQAGGIEDDRPYAHPYYWAAFILLGDPG
jgi:tetratricopeptide (TPR) repeat protein